MARAELCRRAGRVILVGTLAVVAVTAAADSAWSIRFVPRPVRIAAAWPGTMFSRAAYGLILAHLRGRSVAELTGVVDLPDRIFPGAEFRPSPNCDPRSTPAGIDCVVVHATVIDSEETVSKFLDSSAKV